MEQSNEIDKELLTQPHEELEEEDDDEIEETQQPQLPYTIPLNNFPLCQILILFENEDENKTQMAIVEYQNKELGLHVVHSNIKDKIKSNDIGVIDQSPKIMKGFPFYVLTNMVVSILKPDIAQKVIEKVSQWQKSKQENNLAYIG